MMIQPKVYCVGRRRLVVSKEYGEGPVQLHLTQDHDAGGFKHLAHLRLEPNEARKLHRSLGRVLQVFPAKPRA